MDVINYWESDGMLIGSDGSLYNIKNVMHSLKSSHMRPHPYSEEALITVEHVKGKHGKPVGRFPRVERVIVSGPATVVFWDDCVKTVAKCDSGDEFDVLRGIELCMLKRMNGNSYNGYMNAISDALTSVKVEGARW